jgi:hypothetical protein
VIDKWAGKKPRLLALVYADDDGRTERYTFREIEDRSNRISEFTLRSLRDSPWVAGKTSHPDLDEEIRDAIYQRARRVLSADAVEHVPVGDARLTNDSQRIDCGGGPLTDP